MRSMVSSCHHDLAGTVCNSYCFWLASVWMLVPFRLIIIAVLIVTTMPARCWRSPGLSLVGLWLSSQCKCVATTCNMHIAIHLPNNAKYGHHQLNNVTVQLIGSCCLLNDEWNLLKWWSVLFIFQYACSYAKQSPIAWPWPPAHAPPVRQPSLVPYSSYTHKYYCVCIKVRKCAAYLYTRGYVQYCTTLIYFSHLHP